MNSTPTFRKVAARGAIVTVLSQTCRMLVQLVALVLLARLLEPSIFGQMAIVLVVVGIGETLRELGLSSAAIHAKSLTQRQQSNLFWLNVSAGLILCAMTFFAAGTLSKFYALSELASTLQAIAPVFVINGLASQHRARLARQMKFVNLALSELVAVVVGLTLAITLAYRGAGVGALVGQQVAQACAVLIFAVVSIRWIPSLPGRAPMRDLLVYGGNLGATQLINYFARNFDTLLLGRIASAASLGFYNRAFQLVMLPVTQINAPATKVAFPVLARLRDDSARFGRYLRSGQSALMHSVAAVLFLGVSVAEPVIIISLGQQWQPTVLLFQILAVAGVFQTLSYPMYWVFLSMGLTGSNLRYTLLTKAVLVFAIVLGSFWGVKGVAIAFTAASAISWPIGLRWMQKNANIPWKVFAAPAVVSLPVYASASGAGALAVHIAPHASISGVVSGVCAYVAVLGIALALVKAYRKDIRKLASIATELRGSKNEKTVVV